MPLSCCVDHGTSFQVLKIVTAILKLNWTHWTVASFTAQYKPQHRMVVWRSTDAPHHADTKNTFMRNTPRGGVSVYNLTSCDEDPCLQAI